MKGPRLGMGYLYELTDQPRQALAMYQKVLQVNPESLEAQERAGDQYLRLEKFEQAQQVFSRLKQQTQNDFEVRFRIGIIYLENKRLEEAQREFNALIGKGRRRTRSAMPWPIPWSKKRITGRPKRS